MLKMDFKWMIVLSVETCLLMVSCKMEVNLDRETDHGKVRAIRSIKSDDGDIIDCIDIYKQPAFAHPALRDHKIQLKPSYDVKMEYEKMSVGKNEGSYVTVTTQIWHRSGVCPKGTIPIRRRIEKHSNVSKGHSTDDYGRKRAMLPNKKPFDESKMLNVMYQNHSVAILFAIGYAYLGVKGDIKVWNPQVESDDEYTTSQVALKSGPYDDFEAVESGWAVNPSVYGDRQTRLFVYWTADASQKTGCFDLTCPGFVQTSNEIALGAAIYPISNPTGLPYQITLYIHKDPETSNWWVQYGERINIGYWPADLFELLRNHAVTAQWGGDVHSSRVGGVRPHTSTGMGSGRFSDPIMGTSGYVKRMRVLENDLVLRFPRWVYKHSDEYNCYDDYYISDYVADPEFYYGGPGRCYICP